MTKSFGGLRCVDGLDLHVEEGEIVSLIGPNGAGKTTVFNLVTGIYEPDEGDILLEGESIIGMKPHNITKRGVGRTFQTLRLFLNMSVIENVMAAQYGRTKATVFESIFRLPRARREERETRRSRRRSSASSASGSSATGSTSRRTASRTRTAAGSRSRGRWAPARGCLLLDEPAAGMNPNETLRDHRADRRSCARRPATRSS